MRLHLLDLNIAVRLRHEITFLCVCNLIYLSTSITDLNLTWGSEPPTPPPHPPSPPPSVVTSWTSWTSATKGGGARLRVSCSRKHAIHNCRRCAEFGFAFWSNLPVVYLLIFFKGGKENESTTDPACSAAARCHRSQLTVCLSVRVPLAHVTVADSSGICKNDGAKVKSLIAK